MDGATGTAPAMSPCIAEVKALTCPIQTSPASCKGAVKKTQAIEPVGSQWQSLVEVMAPGLSPQGGGGRVRAEAPSMGHTF